MRPNNTAHESIRFICPQQCPLANLVRLRCGERQTPLQQRRKYRIFFSVRFNVRLPSPFRIRRDFILGSTEANFLLYLAILV
jgi:hypothetical protein